MGHVAGVCVSQTAPRQHSISEMDVCVATKVIYSAHLQTPGTGQVASAPVFDIDTAGVQSFMALGETRHFWLCLSFPYYNSLNMKIDSVHSVCWGFLWF